MRWWCGSGVASARPHLDTDGTVVAGAAAHQPKVARFSVDHDRGGLEFLVGVPGSIGGGVRMNAGCFGTEFSDVLIDAEVFDLEDGSVSTRPAGGLAMAYRSTNLTDRHVVTSARLRSTPQPADRGRRRMREITRRRRLTQPGGTLNAGSVFKNPPGDAAGRLIDAAGLKGLTIGGARVSPRHANFFEATEGASAQDVFDLVAEVRRRVREASGEWLEPEIRFLGTFDQAPAGDRGRGAVSTAVDTRIAERRHQVREAWARRRLRWVVAGAGVVLLGAVAYAALDSPWLAVRHIEVSGADRSPVGALLGEAGVTPGTPTIRVRPGAVAAVLESNPWVAQAEVTVTWPGTVGVTVEERVPAAWVDTGDRWVLVAVDGMVVAGGNPPGDAPRVEGEVSGLRPGDRLGDEAAAAVVGFLGRLPPEVVAGATGAATPRGGVVSLGTITVLFGDGTDLDLKAAAVTALLDRGVAPGSTINVISPSRPAVSPG